MQIDCVIRQQESHYLAVFLTRQLTVSVPREIVSKSDVQILLASTSCILVSTPTLYHSTWRSTWILKLPVVEVDNVTTSDRRH